MDLKERRLGRFRISQRMIDANPDACVALMSGFLIVRAESLMYHDAIEYIAFADQFDPVPENEEVPLYLPEMKQEQNEETGEITRTMVGFKRLQGAA